MNANIFPIQELGNKRVIAAGPLTKQQYTLPYRIVLLEYDNGSFSVHNQIFNSVEELNKNGSLSNGNYFQKGELTKATTKFTEKLLENAGCVNSIFRNG